MSVREKLPLVCGFYNNPNKPCRKTVCDRLHICAKGILKQCNCPLSHQLQARDICKLESHGVDVHGTEIYKFISNFCLGNLYENRKKSLFIPKPCLNYNTFGCSNEEECKFMHICLGLFSENNSCEYDLSCSRALNHRFTTRDLIKLKKCCFDISDERKCLNLYQTLIGSLIKKEGLETRVTEYESKIRNRKEPTCSTIKPKIRSEPSEICNHYLEDKCYHGPNCRFYHPEYRTTFIWSYKKENSREWLYFNEQTSDDLETNFCDPNLVCNFVNSDVGNLLVSFLKMDAVSENERILLKRLETKGRLRTRWNWFWENDSGEWKLFNKQSNLDCDVVDQMFVSLNHGETKQREFAANGKRGYTLIMSTTMREEFYQESPTSKTRREIIRRPRPRKLKLPNPVMPKSAPVPTTSANVASNALPGPFSGPHNVCRKHDSKPCGEIKCPMFEFRDRNFLWLVKRDKEFRWSPVSLEVGDELEQNFSNPNCLEASFSWGGKNEVVVFFETGEIRMKNGSELYILRLSYENETPQPWTWYWLENEANMSRKNNSISAFPEILERFSGAKCKGSMFNCNWIPYGSVGDDSLSSNLNCLDIESRYQSNPNSVTVFKTDSFSYQLNFSNFTQTNTATGKVRKVSRRPTQTLETKAAKKASGTLEPPGNWITSVNHQMVDLDPKDSDFALMHAYFEGVLGTEETVSISRIENSTLWTFYATQKQKMLKKLGKENLNEVLLYHGTSCSAVSKIVEDNLDWRLSGSNVGQILGAGTYFSPRLKTALVYSKRQTTGNISERCFFVALVLMGDSALGSSNYRRPPEKFEGDGVLYDSCVDNLCGPDKIAIFDTNQIYPLFVVKLKKRFVRKPQFTEVDYKPPPKVSSTAVVRNSAPISSTTAPSPSATRPSAILKPSPSYTYSSLLNNPQTSSIRTVTSSPSSSSYTYPATTARTSSISTHAAPKKEKASGCLIS